MFSTRRGFIGSCSCLQAAHEGPSRPIPTVLSHRHHHHHQGASFIGVVVVVVDDDALVALIYIIVVVLREKFLVLALFKFSLFQGMLKTIEGFL